ncbi:MAG: PEP-CTERM system histidine kinase PrsK [Nitrospirae bacterium]|nr:PEP-CTERM system histidine kinase PrsK [Nitrospirota bacterium]
MFEMVLSYSAVLFLAASGIFALVKHRTTVNAVLLITVLLLAGIVVFDQLSLQSSVNFATFKQISLYLEALLPGSVLFLAFIYGRQRPFNALSKVRIGFMAALVMFPLAIVVLVGSDLSYSPDFQNERILFLGNPGYWYYIGIMVSLIVALASVEITLTATHGISRDRMKFEAVGIMSLLAVLIFYYSQGLLYRTINMNLVPIRSGVFIIAALLIIYSHAFRGSGTRVSISRHILYRSITLLVVGIYLLGLGLVGEGMRYYGGAFGRDLTIILAFVGAILLLTMLLSQRVRRRAKVYINKHFYAGNKHDYREEWIKLTGRFSLCASLSDVQDAILTVFTETFGVSGASLYLESREYRRYTRVSELSMPMSPVEIRISEELYHYFAQRERVLNLTDGEFQLSATELLTLSRAGAWLVIPLISNKKVIGLAMFRGQIVPELLIYDDFDLMKVLARQAAQAITNLRLSEEIIEMRAMAAVSKVSTFVIHDLKNLTTSLSLCLDNAEEHIGNPDFQKDAISTIRNTLFKMKSLMQRLKSIPEKIMLDSEVKNIDRLSRDVVAEFLKVRPKRILYNGEPAFSRVDGEEIKKVIVNLIQNALDASNEKGMVKVETLKENGSVCIRVSDTGTGMTEDYVKNHLFRPFRTTKETGLGIGLYQCRQIVDAHEGKIEVKSEVGKGTVFTICLPAAETGK